MIALLLLRSAALAHSTEFGVTQLSAREEAPEEVWAASEGWGVLHSTDGGVSWGWLCEESIGASSVYDVLAYAPGVALVATQSGLLRVGADCSSTEVAGLPEGFVLQLVSYAGVAAATVVTAEGRGGVYLCTDTECAPTELEGEGYFPKSLFVEEDRLWATLVHTETLASELLVSADGEAFAVVHAWPNGDTDPKVLWARGESLFLWLRPRSSSGEPGFYVSRDGGESFEGTLLAGYYTDPSANALVLDEGETVLVGSYYGARTWRSTNGGAEFADVSADTPALRCALPLATGALLCADHLADGLDVAYTPDGLDFTPLACLEDVAPSACAAEACAPYVSAWDAAAAYGGGKCDPEVDTGSGEPEPPCGCSSTADSLPGLGLIAVFALGRRYSPRAT